MDYSRVQRMKPQRTRKRFVFTAVLIVCCGVGAVATWAALDRSAPPAAYRTETESLLTADTTPPSATEQTSSLGSSESAEPSSTTGEMLVEVPGVTGKPFNQAELVLSLAGFTVERVPSAGQSASGGDVVSRQEPAAGELLEQGAVIRLSSASRAGSAGTEHLVVCIDPGHQAKSDQSKEPIGPGSDEVKPAVSGGTRGVVTRIPEHVLTLQVSLRLKRILEAQGVQVVMTRTTSTVALTNAQRADIANRAGADLFIRVHADGSPNPATSGMSVLYPGKNRWTSPIAARSAQASACVHDALLAATNARDRGCVAREDITGFNWSKVPAIIVEMGFMTNAAEDRKMHTAAYQERLAKGMAAGVLAYLRAGP